MSTLASLDHVKCKLYIQKALVEDRFNESVMANFVLELMYHLAGFLKIHTKQTWDMGCSKRWLEGHTWVVLLRHF